MTSLERVSAAVCAARYIVEIKYAVDSESDVLAPFDKRQIAAWVCDFWKFENVAVLYAHNLWKRG